MSEGVPAWLLEWPGCPLALAPADVVEIVAEPEIHALPFGPSWCRAVLHWRERLVPLARPQGCGPGLPAVVVAFEPEGGETLEYAAFVGLELPRRIEVVDGADCALPEALPFDVRLVLASFEHEGRIVIVPGLCAMFAPPEGAAGTSARSRSTRPPTLRSEVS